LNNAPERLRIKNVKRIKLNGEDVKIFEVWEWIKDVYFFKGYYSAPTKIPDKNLHRFI